MLPRCTAGGITPGKRRSVYPTWRGNAHGRRGTKLDCRRVLCHRQCSGRDNTGRSGHHGTRFDPRALSGAACGLYEGIREFGRWADPFFKSITAHWCERPPPFRSPSNCSIWPGRHTDQGSIEYLRVEKDAGAECDPVGNPSRLIRSGLGPQYPATRCTEISVIQVGLIWQSRRWTPAPSGRECGTSSEMNVRLSCVMLRGAQDVSK